MQNEIFLHTPRLTLGPLREGDKAARVALFRHDAVKETYRVPDPLDDALADLVRTAKITLDTALMVANDPVALRAQLGRF